jgi:4'-phosphopantetheinyl transferase EntD
MAKKQTRRCISLNRSDYEAAKLTAAQRGVTLTGLVELGLAAMGVPMTPHPQQPPELARANAQRRAQSVAARLPSRERQVLGDQIADACGFA